MNLYSYLYGWEHAVKKHRKLSVNDVLIDYFLIEIGDRWCAIELGDYGDRHIDWQAESQNGAVPRREGSPPPFCHEFLPAHLEFDGHV